MSRPTPRRWLLWLALAFAASLCRSETETREIRFSLVELPGGDDEWLEIAIQIEYRRDSADATLADPGFLDNADVRLDLGLETRRQGRPAFEFYAATAQLVALEEGKTYLRFYLPPEIVERDQVRGEPHSYRVTVSRAGLPLASFASRSLANPSALESFSRRVEAARAANDGVLLPQNRTPFYPLYADETPSFRDLSAHFRP